MTRRTLSGVVLVGLAAACAIALHLRTRAAKNVWETTPGGPYAVTVTATELVCEHPKHGRQSIRLADIEEIHLLTTSEGPFRPDEWYVFSGKAASCSIPAEAKGFGEWMAQFETRFPGLDHQAILEAGTSNRRTLIWKK